MKVTSSTATFASLAALAAGAPMPRNIVIGGGNNNGFLGGLQFGGLNGGHNVGLNGGLNNGLGQLGNLGGLEGQLGGLNIFGGNGVFGGKGIFGGKGGNNNGGVAGAAFFMTNEPTGNFVFASTIGSNGKLTGTRAVATGGNGGHGDTADGPDGLFSQGSLKVSGKNLLVVNAGSNTLSMFSIDPQDPSNIQLVGQPADTQGDFPVSVAANSAGTMACALNSGTANGVACFTIDPTQGLIPMNDSVRDLGLTQTTPPTGPAGTVSHILFTSDDSKLVASVKGQPPAPGFLAVWDVAADGTLSETFNAITPPSGGLLPFGMAAIDGNANALMVTDAGIGFDVIDLNSGSDATGDVSNSTDTTDAATSTDDSTTTTDDGATATDDASTSTDDTATATVDDGAAATDSSTDSATDTADAAAPTDTGVVQSVAGSKRATFLTATKATKATAAAASVTSTTDAASATDTTDAASVTDTTDAASVTDTADAASITDTGANSTDTTDVASATDTADAASVTDTGANSTDTTSLTSITSAAASNVVADGQSTANTVDGQFAVCWAAFSKKTGTFFLTDIGTSQVTEVQVDPQTLAPKIVKQYQQAQESATIDDAVATINGNDFLYVLAANATSIDVLSLPAPGKAKTIQTMNYANAAKQMGITLNPNNVQGMTVIAL